MNDVTEVMQVAAAVLVTSGIEELEKKMLGMEQVPCDVVHHLHPGIYIREVTLRAGTYAVGHYQKHRHTNIMLTGRVVMSRLDGSTSELVAPLMFVGEPGRKAGYIVEDTVWQNVYPNPTNETDIPTLEAMFVDKSEYWKGHTHTAELPNDDDFASVLTEFGYTQNDVDSQVADTSDQIPMPLGTWSFTTGASGIHGIGVFATTGVIPGQVIGPARLNSMRTPLGRYVNHSKTPNAKMILVGGDVYLVATLPIDGCKGGQNGDEITVEYRQVLRDIHQLEGVI